jgi:flagellar basal-body rod modification protein FlgD
MATVNSTSNTSQTDANALSQISSQDKSLDKTAFLKLLVAQMKNQDPLKPVDNTEFVAQLAQFSNLEQVMGINTRLDQLSLQSQGMQNTQISQMVGDSVTVNGSTISTDGTGSSAAKIAFTLDGPSAATSISILDTAGNPIRTIDVGAKNQGSVQFSWDGKNDAGNSMPAGNYKVAVSATNAAGGKVGVSQNTTGIVKAISYEKGYPELQLDNGLAVPVSDLLRVNQTTTPTTTTQL